MQLGTINRRPDVPQLVRWRPSPEPLAVSRPAITHLTPRTLDRFKTVKGRQHRVMSPRFPPANPIPTTTHTTALNDSPDPADPF